MKSASSVDSVRPTRQSVLFKLFPVGVTTNTVYRCSPISKHFDAVQSEREPLVAGLFRFRELTSLSSSDSSQCASSSRSPSALSIMKTIAWLSLRKSNHRYRTASCPPKSHACTFAAVSKEGVKKRETYTRGQTIMWYCWSTTTAAATQHPTTLFTKKPCGDKILTIVGEDESRSDLCADNS